MNKFLSLFIFLLGIFAVHGQEEYAKYILKGEVYRITIDENIVASMNAGSNAMLSATDGKGNTMTLLVPAGKVGKYEAGAGYLTNTVTITESTSNVYTIKTGTIEVLETDGEAYRGKFSGSFVKTGDSKAYEISGFFYIELDM